MPGSVLVTVGIHGGKISEAKLDDEIDGGYSIAAAASRHYASVSVGTDLVAAAPDVCLQKARTWDEGVSSKFSTTPLKDLFQDKKVVIFGLPIEFDGDFDGSFNESLNLGVDLSSALLQPRSYRWSAYVVDGKVKAINIEKALSEVKVSGVDVILDQI